MATYGLMNFSGGIFDCYPFGQKSEKTRG